MTLHMTVTGFGSFCGGHGLRVSLQTLVRFHPFSFWVMKILGCRACAAELRDSLRMARRIV